MVTSAIVVSVLVRGNLTSKIPSGVCLGLLTIQFELCKPAFLGYIGFASVCTMAKLTV